MKEVPNVICSKDLSYIEDALNWTFVCSKKIALYLDLVCDEEVKAQLKITKKMLDKNFEELINILE